MVSRPLILLSLRFASKTIKDYKTLSAPVWNAYVAFGLHDYSPDEYHLKIANESDATKNLRVARCYRKLLENNAKKDGALLQSIPDVETALALSHPGFFDMSLTDMDSFLDPSAKTDDIDMETEKPLKSSLATAAQNTDTTPGEDVSMLAPPPRPAL